MHERGGLKFLRPDHGREQGGEQGEGDEPDNEGFHGGQRLPQKRAYAAAKAKKPAVTAR